ncbi:glycoside hydrolase family 32 protein [Parasphingorhabdus pacifica]
MFDMSRRVLFQLAAAGTAAWTIPRARENRPVFLETYRSEFHFTVPEEWKNDPQRPVFINDTYHYYYLYNADYTGGGSGTAWRLATTQDNVVFRDEGIAIPKNTTPNGDLWSGSAVVDTDDTAGFGAGSVIVLVTQRDHANGDAQAQFLWYSTDSGRTFTPRGGGPVLPNPGVPDFRDPKVVRDTDRGRWVALVAEGKKIGFYASPDLQQWHYTGGFVKDGLGLLECPDLFRIEAADGSATWILGVSANGKASGLPNTYAYWTGEFTGDSFLADTAEPRWLDHGFDWYAAVTWEKYVGGSVDPTRRYALAWMNNWDYAHNTPTVQTDGFNGTDSIVREISLHQTAEGLALASRPVEALDARVARTLELGDLRVEGHRDLPYQGVAYEISAEVTWEQVQNVGMQLRKSGDGTRHVDVGVFGDYVYVNRAATGHPDETGRWLESRSSFDPAAKQVRLRVLVDRTTIEVFVDDGPHTHSHLVFPDPADTDVTLFALGGSALFSTVLVREFNPIR